MKRSMTNETPPKGDARPWTSVRFLGQAERTVAKWSAVWKTASLAQWKFMKRWSGYKDLGCLTTQPMQTVCADAAFDKPVSRAHLREQLMQHEIAGTRWCGALCSVDEETETGSAR
jgi:hypothetical protein